MKLNRTTKRQALLIFTAFGLLLGIASLTRWSALASSRVFTVTSASDPGDGVCDSTCTLREAIAAANAAAGDDSIIFDPVVFNTPQTISLQNDSLPTVQNNGKLTINATAANNLTISAQNRFRVFNVSSGADLTLIKLTVTRGRSTVGGGGIDNLGTLTIIDSFIKANRVAQFVDCGSPELGNVVTGPGGGIRNKGALIIIDSQITDNFACGDGGGVYNDLPATVRITNSIVGNNSTNENGGGIYNKDQSFPVMRDSLVITDSTLRDNYAAKGAGIYTDHGATLIKNSTIYGNFSTDSGGGIFKRYLAILTVTNSTISGNYGVFGGGIAQEGMSTITGSTVADNSANFGGGISVDGSWGGGPTVKSTIIAGNTASFESPDFRNLLNSEGYNLIGNTSGMTITGDTTGNILNVDAQLYPLADNGGLTKTHRLKAISPAVDKGISVGPTTDQRGSPRPFDLLADNAPGGDGTDIGAFELQSLPSVTYFTVTAPANVTVGTQFNFTVTAYDANDEIIPLYNTPIQFTGSDVFAFLPATGTYDMPSGSRTFAATLNTYGNQTITVRRQGNSSITGTSGVISVHPPSAGSIIVTRTNDTNQSCIPNNCSLREAITAANTLPGDDTITFSPTVFATPQTIVLTNGELDVFNNGALTINGGSSKITVSGNSQSRVIDNNTGANLTLNNLTIADGKVAEGAGIFNSGTLTITNSTISGNFAARGAGIYNAGTLTITNSTISGNRANVFDNNHYGGGIYNSSITSTVAVSGSTITDNFATHALGGGGVRNEGGAFTVANTIIAGNSTSLGSRDFSGTLTSQGYNLIGNTSGTTITGDTTGNILNQNPLLAPLADNGGATKTHRLQLNSPATDKGKSFGSMTDQRGLPRPVDIAWISNAAGGDGSDIGAFEAPSPLVVTAPASATADVLFDFTVTVDPEYTGTIRFTSSDPTATLPGDYTFVPGDNGIRQFSAKLKTLGNQTITATDSVNSAINDAADINVIPGPAVRFAVSAATPVLSGVPIIVTVTAFDRSDNIATGYNGTVHFTGTDATASLPADYTFVPGDNGTRQFSATLRTVGNQTITVTDTANSTLTKTSNTITVHPASSNLVVTRADDRNQTCMVGDCSLREAVKAANALSSSDTITLDPTAFAAPQTITLVSGELDVLNNGTLTINGASKLVISGNNQRRAFRIRSGANLTLNNLTVSNGAADGGGGIFNTGTLAIINSTISDNYSPSACGGIVNAGTLVITRSTVSGNKANRGWGGGICNFGGFTATITNSTISGNEQTNFDDVFTNGGGGGIHNLGMVTITGSTITNNKSLGQFTWGGGINNESGGTVTVANTIIAGNTAAQGPDFRNTIASQGYNLIGNTTDTTITGDTTGNILNQPALLAPLANYGGTTDTYALLPGSPAINAGDNCVLTANGCGNNNPALPTDQRGIARVGTVDIGAFESRGFTLAIAGGDNQAAPLNTVFAVPLRVDVTSSFSEPVNGGRVTFTPPASGASATIFQNLDTIASGLATGIATANNTLGSYQVGAAANGGTAVNFNLTNTCVGGTGTLGGGGTICATQSANVTVTVSGGVAPYTVVLTNGGGTRTGNGPAFTFSVTPGATTSYQVAAGSVDANGCAITNSGTVTVTVNAATGIMTPPTSQTKIIGQSVTFNVAATGVNLSYQWRKGGMPIGGAMASSYTINAVSFADQGSYEVVVTGTCGNATSSAAMLAVTCQTITVNAPATTTGTAGAGFSQSFTQTGGNGATGFSLQSGTLPTGLTFAANGLLSGTPTQTGSFPLVVKATDSNNCMSTANYTLVIGCPTLTLGPNTLNGGQVGAAYAQQLSVMGAFGNSAAFTVSAGALPNGLTLSSAGLLSGTPTASFNGSVTIKAQDALGCFVEKPYTLAIVCNTLALSPATLPNGVQGTAYNQTLAATPASTTYSYAVTTNVLPPGLSLNSATGALTGTPTAPGNYTFVITVTGLGGCTKSQSYTVAITGTCPTITINPASLPGGTVGAAYNQTISATGGAAPYSFAVTQGALPAGLALDTATGVISGTPTAGGAASFRLTATGQGGCTGSRQYVLNITCAALSINPATTALPGATRGAAYSQAITVTPAANYNFSLLLGQLPLGFTLNSSGVISGVTTQTGTYSFTLKVTGGSCQTTKSYTLTVAAGLTALAQQADYDGDGKTDFVLSSGQGSWKLLLSGGVQRQTQTLNWGAAGDLNLLGDYDGDGLTDLAAFRPSDGTWHVKQSSDGGYLTKAWGMATDVPVPGDYDGDGKTDIAVFRPSEGNWYVLRSSDQQYQVTAWGAGYAPYHDVAVPGDYDGDGRTDLAVFRRATGTWLVKRSSNGTYLVKQWGLGTDTLVAADYDGDGQTDLAVWRQGTWYIWQSTTGSYRAEQWGSSAAPYFDRAVPGDYDGDGQADIAVWRSSTGTWYIVRSSDGQSEVVAWGAS
jgi:CSLREA domain-containing protein